MQLLPAGSFYCIPGNGGCYAAPLWSYDFYFPQPDGTFLIYTYNPRVATTTYATSDSLNESDVDSTVPINIASTTEFIDGIPLYTNSFIEAITGRAVVSPSVVSANDLEQVGVGKTSGSPVYDLKDKNHPLYQAFYNYYVNYVKGRPYGLSTTTAMSYDQFISTTPFILWGDEFGRLFLFKNKDLLDPGGYCNDCFL